MKDSQGVTAQVTLDQLATGQPGPRLREHAQTRFAEPRPVDPETPEKPES